LLLLLVHIKSDKALSLPNEKYFMTLQELKELMNFYPTLEETASWFNCSADSIERLIKKELGITFKQFRIQHSGKTRLLLKRKAISKALEENDQKMLIYCLRAMTDLNDKAEENKEPQESVIRLCYSEKNLYTHHT
jgi:AraC-like DNA-binding protein